MFPAEGLIRINHVKNPNTGSHTIVWTQENTAQTDSTGLAAAVRRPKFPVSMKY